MTENAQTFMKSPRDSRKREFRVEPINNEKEKNIRDCSLGLALVLKDIVRSPRKALQAKSGLVINQSPSHAKPLGVCASFTT